MIDFGNYSDLEPLFCRCDIGGEVDRIIAGSAAAAGFAPAPAISISVPNSVITSLEFPCGSSTLRTNIE